MDAKRLRRYVEKLAHAEDRLSRYESWRIGALTDLRDRLASYKALQEVAESMSDVAAMFAVDAKQTVKDDRMNFKLMAERRVFSANVAAQLAELSGLRNVLVHEYDGIDDARAFASAAELVPGIRSAIEEVRAWLSKSG
ncbi:MAG: DUF86 domain-containing protein [Candidatus Thermoplasmatota archaeon]